MKLHLGCGKHYMDGWVNIDNSRFAKFDLEMNLDQPTIKLPFKDDEVDEARAIDFFEHVTNFIPLMNELWRVMAPGSQLYLEVPLAGTDDFYKDPTHVRPFVPNTFKYLAEWNTNLYGIAPWVIVEIRHTTGGENCNRIFCTLTPRK